MPRALRLLAASALLAALGYAGAVAYFVRQIRTFPPVTFAVAATDPAQVADFGLDGRRTPAAWGARAYREEPFASRPSGLRLGGWWVPPDDPAAGDSARCAVVFVHGRGDNRLKALKYLPLVRRAGLLRACGAFFPDLRNSGTSAPGDSDMGLGFADDVASAAEHLAGAHGTRRVVFYSFSVGALATAYGLATPPLAGRIAAAGVAVDRLVLDSPMANVRAVVTREGARRGLPGPLVASALWAFDRRVGGRLDALRLGPLLARLRMPVLVVQGAADTITPPDVLRDEQAAFPPTVRVVVFPTAGHVKIVQHARQGAPYARVVEAFLRPAAR